MDKVFFEDMKAHAAYVFREHKDSAMNIQAIQAYAALCQAEALERIADALAITDEERELLTIRKQFSQDLELLKAEQIQGGKGDQSIADAISEQVTDPPDTNWAADYICIQGHQHGSESFRLRCDVKVLR